MKRPGVPLAVAAALLALGGCSAESADAPEPDAPAATAEAAEATSLFGTPLRRPALPGETRARLEGNLEAAETAYAENPGDEDAAIWLGRRLAYLSRYAEAIDVFSRALEAHPDSYRLRRHRGHRYISTRRFDLAIDDLTRAAALAEDHEDQIEPDGAPNARGIPLGTDKFNIWYHLGLAHYLEGDFENALRAYRRCMEYSTNPDLLVATTDWMVMTLRRLGRHADTLALLAPIDADLDIIENDSYHRRLLMYKGQLAPAELLGESGTDDPDEALQLATQGYGVANWHLTEGNEAAAIEILERILEGTSWAAFGYIAAEADLYRLRADP